IGVTQSLSRLLALHLIPGLGIVTFYLGVAPVVASAGFPPEAALLLGFVLVGMPVELGILKREARRTGRASVLDVIEWRAPMPLWLFGVLLLGLCGCVLAIFALLPLSRIADYLAAHVFAWLPYALRP